MKCDYIPKLFSNVKCTVVLAINQLNQGKNMKNIKLLIITTLFSSLLIGCGMKGVLYRAPTTQEKEPIIEEKEAQVESATKEAVVAKIQDDQEAVVIESYEDETAIEAVQTEATQNTLFTPKSLLFAVEPSHFTLQLMVMESVKTLEQFVAEHNLPQKDVYVYQTAHNNKSRYVVIFGDYKNKQAAKMASKNLPGSFANMETWAKPYQLVQQELLLIK